MFDCDDTECVGIELSQPRSLIQIFRQMRLEMSQFQYFPKKFQIYDKEIQKTYLPMRSGYDVFYNTPILIIKCTISNCFKY